MRGKFFKCLQHLRVLAGMERTRADVGKAKLSQQRSLITLVISLAKPFLDDALQINASPANDTIDAEIRPRINKGRQFGLLIGGTDAARRPRHARRTIRRDRAG